MLAYGQLNLGLCGGERPPNWAFGSVLGRYEQFWAFGQVSGPSAQLRGLLPSFEAFCPVLGPSAQFRGLGPLHRMATPTHTNKQTEKHSESTY